MANIKRANASSITKSGVAIADVPDRPTIGAVADAGDGTTATVAYTAAVTGGAATTFTATSSPGGFTGTGSSPISVTGLSAGTAYTFTVTASNSTGSSPASSASSSLTLAAVGKYESIASVVGTGSSQLITLSSIPSTYKHLQIRGIFRSTEAGSGTNFYMYVNGDTATNYSYHTLRGDGTTVTSSGNASVTKMFVGRAPGAGTTAGIMNATILDILDYANVSKYKTFRHISGKDDDTYGGDLVLRSGLWMSTSAITSITFIIDNPNFSSLSSVALYGIKG